MRRGHRASPTSAHRRLSSTSRRAGQQGKEGRQVRSGLDAGHRFTESCGRLARRRKAGGRQSVPARAQHSASLKAITARQLQALVRQRAHELRSRLRKARATARFLDGGRYGRTRAAEIVREHHWYELQVCLEPKEERLGYRRDL